MSFLYRIFEPLRNWTLKWAHSPYMAGALFFIAFIESSFFPIPPDVLLIAILLVRPGTHDCEATHYGVKKWWFYAGLTTIGSVLGAFLGYAIGWGFYETLGVRIADTYSLHDEIKYIGLKFQDHAFLTVFTAAFSPIPYKVITITAGLFKVSLFQLAIASIIGRGLRYFALAYLIKLFGKQINELIYKYFNILSILFVLLVIILFIAAKFLF